MKVKRDLVVIWFEIQVVWLRPDLRFKWFGCQLVCDSNDFGSQVIWDSSDLVVNWFEIQLIWISNGLRFNWFGCQMIWDSNWCVIQIILVLKWFEIQVIWLWIDLRFNWFGCQAVWDSIDYLVVKWFGIQVIWLPTGLGFNRIGDFVFCKTSFKNEAQKRELWCQTSFKIESLKLKNEAFVRDFLQKWRFEGQKHSVFARLPSRMKLWSPKTKLLRETSFKNEALKLKNEAFARDLLQKRSFDAPKRSFSARLPSKMKIWRSKTQRFCETSIKNEALKPKNEAFARDFLQKWSFEAQKRSFCARLPSKMKLWSSKTKLLRETSFKNEALKVKNETFLRDFLQKWYVDQTLDLRITIHFRAFSKWMLRKYCACHEKVEPRHTNSCNCYAKWSLL